MMFKSVDPRRDVIVDFSTGFTKTVMSFRAPYVASKAGVDLMLTERCGETAIRGILGENPMRVCGATRR